MEGCDVMLYALSTCIHCQNTKEFLNKCGKELQSCWLVEASCERRAVEGKSPVHESHQPPVVSPE